MYVQKVFKWASDCCLLTFSVPSSSVTHCSISTSWCFKHWKMLWLIQIVWYVISQSTSPEIKQMFVCCLNLFFLNSNLYEEQINTYPACSVVLCYLYTFQWFLEPVDNISFGWLHWVELTFSALSWSSSFHQCSLLLSWWANRNEQHEGKLSLNHVSISSSSNNSFILIY